MSGCVTNTRMPDSPAPSQASFRADFRRYIPLSGGGNPLHRVRTHRRPSREGGGEAGSLPPDGGGGPRPAAFDGLRDGVGPAELPGGRRDAAHADRHPRAGVGRSGDGRGYGVEQGRGAGGAALPVTSGKEKALETCCLRLFHNRRLTPVVAPEFGHVLPPQDVRIIFELTGQPGSPGRGCVGSQQPRHQATERTFPVRVAGKGPHADAPVQQAPGHVPAGVAVRRLPWRCQGAARRRALYLLF